MLVKLIDTNGNVKYSSNDLESIKRHLNADRIEVIRYKAYYEFITQDGRWFCNRNFEI